MLRFSRSEICVSILTLLWLFSAFALYPWYFAIPIVALIFLPLAVLFALGFAVAIVVSITAFLSQWRQRRWRALLPLAMCSAAVLLFSLMRPHGFKRSILAQEIRFWRGEGGAHQMVYDLVEDIRETPSLAQMQPWCIEALKRSQSGELRTTGFGELGYGLLAKEEIPAFITKHWGYDSNAYPDEPPKISVRPPKNGEPGCAFIAWPYVAIAIGPAGFHSFVEDESQLREPSCYVKLKPGMYVFALNTHW
jgi:hypothetical protein